MEYIERILGVKMCRLPWKNTTSLPYLYFDLYEFEEVRIDDIICVFLQPKQALQSIPVIKKHIYKIQSILEMPIVIETDKLSGARQEALIQERIPFVVKEQQIYLPFLGVALKNKSVKNLLHRKSLQRLTPTAQVFLLKYIYFLLEKEQYTNFDRKFYLGEIAKKLNVSAMNVTRTVEQLEEFQLAESHKDGTKIYLQTKYTGRELFQKALPYLKSPVQKKVYISISELNRNFSFFLKAGETALAEQTMLGVPKKQVYAIDAKRAKRIDLNYTSELIDETRQVEVELWRYDPVALSQTGYVDSLSLILSIDSRDERVEQMQEELFERL